MTGMDSTPDGLRNKTIALAPLLEILECPVCLETVKIPFMLCRIGHMVCKGCAEWLRNCPMCRGEFCLDTPLCVKNLIETLPKKCRFSGNGCSEIVEPNDDHESFCRYRQVKCVRCHKETRVYLYKQHLQYEHEQFNLHTLKSSQLSLKNFQTSKNCFHITMYLMNTLFLLTIARRGAGEIDLIFKAVLDSKPSDDYFITLKFEKDLVGPRVTLKALENLNENREDDECSTRMFPSMVKRCINDDNALVIDYELAVRPKPA